MSWPPEGGESASTEIRFRGMRAEDHHPRKSDGTKPNCGYAARSRSVKPCERPSSPACGRGTDVILVGWLSWAVPDHDSEIFRYWRSAVLAAS